MRFELIVFDWDGTLVDSSDAIAEAVRSAATGAGLPVPTIAAARNIIGLGLREVAERLFPGASDAELAGFGEAFRDLYWAAPDSFTRPFAGIDGLLTELAGRAPLAVATGKGRRGLDAALVRTGLGRHFAGSRTADETRSKPHPQMLIELMDELGVAPASTLMVGDTSFDMEMARAAGAHGLGVLGGSHEDSELREAGASVVLGATVDLGPWLKARYEPD